MKKCIFGISCFFGGVLVSFIISSIAIDEEKYFSYIRQEKLEELNYHLSLLSVLESGEFDQSIKLEHNFVLSSIESAIARHTRENEYYNDLKGEISRHPKDQYLDNLESILNSYFRKSKSEDWNLTKQTEDKIKELKLEFDQVQ